MSRIYLETSAVRKLTNYKGDGDIFTSCFVLFELISGISSPKEFSLRRACIKRIIEQEITIEPKMVDQVLYELVGAQGYRQNLFDTLYAIALDILKLNSFEEFEKIRITFTHDKPIIYNEQIPVLSWLQNWDEKISNIRKNSGDMFQEDKDFIKSLYHKGGLKEMAKYYWNLYDSNKVDERRLESLSAFRSENDANKVRESINNEFSQYNFKLFATAQAIVFAKAKYLDGGTQDKNNPSDLLHLLYLNKGDIIVTADKIYDTIAEGIEDFNLIKINNEKCITELIKM